jgi:spermidine/putrescine transport system substrate-binding protein
VARLRGAGTDLALRAEYGVKVNFKTYIGGDQMFSIFTHSKGLYDVVVADPEYIAKLHAAGRIVELNPADYEFKENFTTFQKFPLASIDGKLYAVPVHWGSNGLVYNTKYITGREAESYKILFDPKVKGHVGIWDWYLPSLGVLSRSLGNTDPYNLTDEQFDALKRRAAELRPQVAAIHPNVPDMLSALANEQTWIVPAGGEWVAAILQAQGKPIDWSVPKEGGVLWAETLTIANDAPHPDLAKLYIQWSQTPEAQARLSQVKANYANVANAKAYELLPEAHKDLLKIHNAADAEALLSRLSIRTLPQKQSEDAWQDAWDVFKIGH